MSIEHHKNTLMYIVNAFLSLYLKIIENCGITYCKLGDHKCRSNKGWALGVDKYMYK